jgi:hypothetical protein
MAKVKFLSKQQPRTGRPEGDPVYEAGKVYDLRDDQARKWVSRSAAVFVRDDEEPAPASPLPQESPTPPESRAARGLDQDDPGVDAPKPDAMTLADIKPPTTRPRLDDFEDMLREDLLELAEKRGIDLGPGYHKKEDVIAALRGSQSND